MGSILRRSCSTNTNEVAPNPSPERWELLRILEFKYAHVMKVRYLDCTNYEGVKVMVFAGAYHARKILDPHFDETDTSPIARFRPDDEGWRLAVDFARAVNKE